MTIYFGMNNGLVIERASKRDYGADKFRFGIEGVEEAFEQFTILSETEVEELVRYLSGWLRASDKED